MQVLAAQKQREELYFVPNRSLSKSPCGARKDFSDSLRETVRKGFKQRTNHEFGQYAEHEIGQKETSQQPIGLILRARPRPSDCFLEDDFS